LRVMYPHPHVICLGRKKAQARQLLNSAGVAELVQA
jgi:hypothetical protein